MFAVLAGRMEDESYLQSCHELYSVLDHLGQRNDSPKECLSHRRGNYLALDSGVTHGPGSDTITNAVPNSFGERLNELLASKPVRRIIGFCDGA